MNIKTESLKQQLKADWAGEFVSADAERVIITIPENLNGKVVDYVTWDGKDEKGDGFLLSNETDRKTQFLEAKTGIIIGHEGLCPDENGKMIQRSEAVEKYLLNNPNAFSSEDGLHSFVSFIQNNVFKHGDDVVDWDEHARSDIWTSNISWLKKNFHESSIYDEQGAIKQVISAPRVSDARYKVIFLGPNASVEGIGVTGESGSYVVQRPDGSFNLCTAEVFNKTYKRDKIVDPAKFVIKENGSLDVQYPKGSMRYMDPYMKSTAMPVSERLARDKIRVKNLETPVLRVIGAALCDVIEKDNLGKVHPLELYIGSLEAMDKSELKLTSRNSKVKLLGTLLENKIIDSQGKVLNFEALSKSSVVKNFNNLGFDLSETKTFESTLKRNTNNKDKSKAKIVQR